MTITTVLLVESLLLVTTAATVAALTRDPVRQAVVLSMLGLCLAVLFTVFQAPDVAMSQLAVGSAVSPLLLLLTVRKLRDGGSPDGNDDGHDNGGHDNGSQNDGGEGGTT